MTAKTEAKIEKAKTETPVQEAVSKAQSWNKEAAEKLRELAAKVNSDFRTTGNIAIEGHAQHNSRLFQLVGDILNKRTAATMSLLEANDLKQAIEIEQEYARDAVQTLQDGVKELSEISLAAFKDASATYSDRAKDVIDGLSRKKDA